MAVLQPPASPHFTAVRFRGGNLDLAKPPVTGIPRDWAKALPKLPRGELVAWGLPFDIRRAVLLQEKAVHLTFAPVKSRWLVFLHTLGPARLKADTDGFYRPARGQEPLGEPAAQYTLEYADGSQAQVPVRRRYEVGSWSHGWPMNGLQCVPHCKPRARTIGVGQMIAADAWGWVQTRVSNSAWSGLSYWLYAWQNANPGKAITGLRLEPAGQPLLLAGISVGDVAEHPLRWRPRRKAVLRLPAGVKVNDVADDTGTFAQMQIDMGQIISVTARRSYDHAAWTGSYNNQPPQVLENEAVVEYSCHPEAVLHVAGGATVTAAALEKAGKPDAKAGTASLTPVAPVQRLVTLRVVDKASGKPVPVRLHLHGEAGEYLAPVDRNREPNAYWYQDWSVDYSHWGRHHATYIDGETRVSLPQGRVFLEVSKGFEIRPVRQVLRVTGATREIVVELEKVLPWRERGWVTADTHVHFLSPPSAQLEGAAEGVNIVNLLASQWGELMTNVGDFDGKTTFGSREAGGDGEHLVRVGTENRQAALGHISLLGYNGRIIAPMTVGGPDESAIGDPIDVLLSDWAKQCRKQGGVVVLPHFPLPRAENAAAIVSGLIDGVEMTSWGNMYGGLDPYSLSDWYRFLNCGYLTAAVAGTDKMSATTAIGTVRTYALIDRNRPFTYDAWKAAVRQARTFVSYGPLLEFSVDGQPAGSRLQVSRRGGTVDVTWEVASVTIPMTRVELLVNGEVRDGRDVKPDCGAGHFTAKLERSSWLALLVRGQYPDQLQPIIAAHTSPVMVDVAGTEYGAAADALTILEQIEGSIAFLDTIGTRAETTTYKRLRLSLVSAHRDLHNRMHRMGFDHQHHLPHRHAAHRGK